MKENIIKQRRRDLHLSQEAVGKLLGVSQQHIQRYENGYPVPISKMDKLSQILHVEKTAFLPEGFSDSGTIVVELSDSVNIDMLDVSACCGDGTENDLEPVVGAWRMPLADYNAISLASPENIKLIKAVGDSMTPTVSDGDYVFVDISNQSINSDGVYVLRLPTGLSIKRIQNSLTGDVIVRSDNPAYEPLTAKLGEVKILGRVVRVLNQRKI